MKIKILYIDDDSSDIERFKSRIAPEFKKEMILTSTREDLHKALAKEPDVIISKYHPDEIGQLDDLRVARERNEDIPFIFWSKPIGEEKAASLIKEGASDFILEENLPRIHETIVRNYKEYLTIKSYKELMLPHAESMRNEKTFGELRPLHKVKKDAKRIISKYPIVKSFELIETLSRENKSLLRTNEQLNYFAMIVAHDLKSPLRAIHSVCDSLLDSLHHTKERRSIIQIKEILIQMNHLITQILNYSKSESIQATFIECDLNEVVKSAISLCNPRRDQTIEILNPLPTLFINRVQFVQVFQNLISNALEFHNKIDGHVYVRYAFDKNTEEHIFSIEDDGPGIPAEYHDKIFSLFRSYGHKKEKSMGIGLTIVKKIIKSYNGKAWVLSDGKKGSTFKFSFPKDKVEIN